MSSFQDRLGLHGSAALRRAKMPPKKRAVNDAQVIKAARAVGRTTKIAAPRVSRTVTRTVARTPAPRPTARPPVDPLDAVLANLDRSRSQSKKKEPKSLGVITGGASMPLPGTPVGGFSLGHVLSNFGGDVISTATSAPSLAMLLGENVAGVAVSPAAALSHAGVPKTKWADRYVRKVLSTDKQAAKATGADLKYRWGPLFQGNIPLAGHRVAEHPGFALMDAATAYSAGGGAIAKASKLAAGLAPDTRLGATLARVGDRSILPAGERAAPGAPVSTGTRYRGPKVREVNLGPNSVLKKRGVAVARVETPRRPFSSNPITRGIQKKVLGPAAERVVARINRRVAANPEGIMRHIGSDARFRHHVANQARDLRLAEEGTRTQALTVASQPFIDAAKALDRAGATPLRRGGTAKWTPQQVDAALFLHGQDLLDVAGKTPKQALNDVVKFMQAGNKDARASGLKDPHSLDSIRAIESVPDELLNLTAGAPKELTTAVAEYRALSKAATATREAAGTITHQSALEVPKRFAQMVHEGITYDPKTGTWTSPRNPYSNVGKNAVYVKHEPVDLLRTGQAGEPGSAFGRMTNPRDRASHGTFASTGNISLSRGLPIKALEKAITDVRHPEFVKEFYDTFAFHNKTADGRLRMTTGKRATLAMEADPKNVTLISAKSLDDAIKASRNLKPGELPDMGKLTTFSGNDGLTQIGALSKAQKKELVAVPKAAIDALRTGWSGSKPIAFYDTPLQAWRKGILALAPRWYINNAFGNTLQFGLLTGGDIKAIWQARKMRSVIPHRVGGSTVVADTMRNPAILASKSAGMRRYDRVTQLGMDFNNKWESAIHEAAYVSSGKRLLSKEGVKVRGMTPDMLEEAFHKMPNALKEQALRDTELFMGDYLRLQPKARAILRRVFPFYSWMRVIGKLMGSMPFRTPKRTAVAGLIARGANEVYNPLDKYERVLQNRGMAHFGPFAMRTSGSNPFATPVELVKAIGNADPGEIADALRGQLTPIGGQQVAQLISGKSGTGVPISAPPGYGGSYGVYGGPLMRRDPTTGVSDYYTPSVPMDEMLLQAVPLLPQIARALSAGERRPYDVVRTYDLIRYRLTGKGDPGQLFLPKSKKKKAVTPIPYVTPLAQWAGANIQRYDRDAQVREINDAIRRAAQAKAATARSKRKAR